MLLVLSSESGPAVRQVQGRPAQATIRPINPLSLLGLWVGSEKNAYFLRYRPSRPAEGQQAQRSHQGSTQPGHLETKSGWQGSAQHEADQLEAQQGPVHAEVNQADPPFRGPGRCPAGPALPAQQASRSNR